MKNKKSTEWNKIYKKLGVVQKESRDSVKALVPLFKKEKVRKILDLGCGSGRHTIFLAQQDFLVVGSDNAQSALDITQKIAKEVGIDILLLQNDMASIPSPNEHFDAIICYDVIQHGLLKNTKKIIDEMERVLKKNGLIFVGVVSRKHYSYGIGKEIEPGTFVGMKDKLDGHIPHHFFAESEIRDLFSDFDIIELKENICPSELDPGKMGGEWLLIARKKR